MTEKYSDTMVIRIRKDQVARLDKFRVVDQSRTQWVRRAVENEIERQEKSRKKS